MEFGTKFVTQYTNRHCFLLVISIEAVKLKIISFCYCLRKLYQDFSILVTECVNELCQYVYKEVGCL